MSLVISGDTSGSVTVAVPAVAGTNTVTIPATTGTVMVSSNMPAFLAYLNVDQTISNSTQTKIQYGSEYFDTNNNYDSTTNYRFTPTVAGYYQINGTLQIQGNATGTLQLSIFKNGSRYIGLSGVLNSALLNPITSGSAIVYCNGTTDYIELYVFQSSGGNLSIYGLGSSGGQNYFSASMVRAA